MMNIKVTRELKESLETLVQMKHIDENYVIQTQDLFYAMMLTDDTGFGRRLGSQTITAHKVRRLLDEAIIVEERNTFTPDTAMSEDAYFSNRRGRRKFLEQFKNSPLEILQEKESNNKINVLKDFKVSEDVYNAFVVANDLAMQANTESKIDTFYFLIAFSQDESSNAHYLLLHQTLKYDLHVDTEDISKRYTFSNLAVSRWHDGYKKHRHEEQKEVQNKMVNRLNDPDYSLLNDISVDLTKEASTLSSVIGREDEIKQLELILTRKNKNNAALVGDGGVGKSAIIEGLAKKIASGEIQSLKNIKILQFNLSTLMNRIGNHFSQGIIKLQQEMEEERDVILYIDEMHMLAQLKSLTDILKPLMARGDFRIIGCTTREEFRMIQNDKALTRRFDVIEVEEPSIEETTQIIKKSIHSYEKYYTMNYSKEVLEKVANIAKEYLPSLKLPDSAFTLLDNAGAVARLEYGLKDTVSDYINKRQAIKDRLEAAQQIEYNEQEVDRIRKELDELKKEYENELTTEKQTKYEYTIMRHHLKEAVERRTNDEVDESLFYSEEEKIQAKKEKIATLETALKNNIIGQDEAIKSVTKVVKRSTFGVTDDSKPEGVFLFVGNTGVGKTETVKALTRVLKGNESKMIRIDMSEYQQPHEVSKLIGSPPGYAGSTSGGQLTNKVIEQPDAIILFDEIEKAHPKVLDLLLQVFDDGRLTDSLGREVDFTKTIIFMTSNIGAAEIANKTVVGFEAVETDDKEWLHYVKQNLRPELYNRIDEIIVFKEFTEEAAMKITTQLVEEEISKLEELGMIVTIDDNFVEWLVSECYEKEYGARPLKRAVKNFVTDPVIDWFGEKSETSIRVSRKCVISKYNEA